MNYKADGTPFWNQFFVAALRDDTGKVNHLVPPFIGLRTMDVSVISISYHRDASCHILNAAFGGAIWWFCVLKVTEPIDFGGLDEQPPYVKTFSST